MTRQIAVETGRFAANLLAADQADLPRRFRQARRRFAGLAYRLGSLDLPALDGAAVATECELENTFEFGTYDLLVGRVRSLAQGRRSGVLTWCDRVRHPYSDGAPARLTA